ncbi:3-phenylpropionate-dihydrodiol/cinnamic acid-dihydrodiol dehydrogenase [Cupriavidus yeoncheonensis]|uniref:3-phenylpropionate-dihydrodiol/cinnamic acid-dihydrodiol dehydrogenase n=1 Tax=Cupriavidus yeoncheonensis TaxID=1462994 RepID=A0A916J0Z7_9BURK|nr:SDR family NAD(P)-dependent oxidoreductase [Cupriavidus yeoncheonensis]CAG2158415.1 3-phenylpropionate-dihydrodiol/cinnamic acid-dihydrodiol dehydrogenase [Cupriavidus yeoncheonensis]
MSKVWLITGSGSGLGRIIAEAALAAGNQVVATARNVRQLDELVALYGANVRVVGLDVTDESQGQAAVDAGVDAFGRLDVVVNNAGYGDTRPFEQVSSNEFRRLVETCFFGVVNLTRAALPVMRKQRRGHIIQISSLGGRTAFPGNAAYFASKWAVGGFTEGLAQETAPFGVKITALEPGGMRTNWGKRAHADRPVLLPDYEPSVGASVKQMEGYWGNESGDPFRVAQVVLRIAETETVPPHILLGSDAFQFARQAEQARTADADRWQAVSASTDVGAVGPIPTFPTN